jgi:peptide chain release factor
MTWLQITANTGPVECCLGVAKALAQLEKEAKAASVHVQLLEQTDGPVAGTLRSVLAELVGKPADVEALANRWSGSILWIWESSFRPGHKRKNWFLGAASFAPPAPLSDSEVVFEATKSSGPGGQHVNKTESAIRATHVATGLSVKVQSERSQHANKRLASQLLAAKLSQVERADAGARKAERRLQHHQTQRGNAERVFVGASFAERGKQR